jgi:hypothetical protein
VKWRDVRGLAVLAAAGVAISCLPGDERPTPGEILVTARPSDATASGFTTEDGWTITFERFLTGLGNVDLDGLNDRRGGNDGEETCSDYSQTNYEWLIDFAAAESRQKVGLVHGLGSCSVEYRVRGPSDDTVLGTGATESDLQVMDVEGADSWSSGEEVTLVVSATARKGDQTKLLLWFFRHSYEVSRCEAEDGGDASARTIEGGDALELPIEVRGEELFRETADDAAPLLFDRLAAADANADGAIDLEELALAPMPPELLPVPEPPGEPDPEEPFEQPESLGDLIYEVLLPRVTRIEGAGPCETELRERRGR